MGQRRGQKETGMPSGLEERVLHLAWCQEIVTGVHGKWSFMFPNEHEAGTGWTTAIPTQSLRIAGTKLFSNSVATTVQGSSSFRIYYYLGGIPSQLAYLTRLRFSHGHVDTEAKSRGSAFLCSKECLLPSKKYVGGWCYQWGWEEVGRLKAIFLSLFSNHVRKGLTHQPAFASGQFQILPC